MNALRKALACVFLLSPISTAFAAPALPPNTAIYQGQQITSPNGVYRLILQTDGNLVYYKSDGAVRFATYSYGNVAVMQGDGNFVEYSGSSPVWHTRTSGNAGAYLTTQDDGNLVVYSSTGVPLWNIGADLKASLDPTQTGDVVGRDLDAGVLGPLGHLGIWDGSVVFQSGPSSTGQVIHFEPFADFKLKTIYWGAAKPIIPSYYITDCYRTYCGYDLTGIGTEVRNGVSVQVDYRETTTTRLATAKRAYQIYLLGADYTVSTSYLEAKPAMYGSYGVQIPAQRGRYRCDMFVLNVLKASVLTGTFNSDANRWANQIKALDNTSATPKSMYDALKVFH